MGRRGAHGGREGGEGRERGREGGEGGEGGEEGILSRVIVRTKLVCMPIFYVYTSSKHRPLTDVRIFKATPLTGPPGDTTIR